MRTRTLAEPLTRELPPTLGFRVGEVIEAPRTLQSTRFGLASPTRHADVTLVPLAIPIRLRHTRSQSRRPKY